MTIKFVARTKLKNLVDYAWEQEVDTASFCCRWADRFAKEIKENPDSFPDVTYIAPEIKQPEGDYRHNSKRDPNFWLIKNDWMFAQYFDLWKQGSLQITDPRGTHVGVRITLRNANRIHEIVFDDGQLYPLDPSNPTHVRWTPNNLVHPQVPGHLTILPTAPYRKNWLPDTNGNGFSKWTESAGYDSGWKTNVPTDAKLEERRESAP